MLHLSSETKRFHAGKITPAPIRTTTDRIQQHKALGRTLFSLRDDDRLGIARIRRQRECILRSFVKEPPQSPSDAAALIRYVLTLSNGFELSVPERGCLKAIAASLLAMPVRETD